MKSEWDKAVADENEEFRVANCGNFCMVYFDPSIKEFKVKRFYCNKFQICETCLDRRVKHFRRTLGIPSMCFAITAAEDDRDTRELVRRVAEDFHTKFPREDGMVTYFIGSRNISLLDIFSRYFPLMLGQISDREFAYICSTPRGRKVTGFAAKSVEDVQRIFSADVEKEDTLVLGLTIPFITAKVSDHRLDYLFEQVDTKKNVYPDDYSNKDSVEQLESICALNIRYLTALLKRDGIIPKQKVDFFQFMFPVSLFSHWEQDDLF